MIRRLDRQVWLVEALRSSARVGGRKRTEGGVVGRHGG